METRHSEQKKTGNLTENDDLGRWTTRFLARHITAWRPIPLLPTSSQYMIESYVYCRVFYIQMSQSNESNVPCCPKNQTKDPATCSKNNRGLPPIRGKSSPSQTAGSLLKKLWESGLARLLGHPLSKLSSLARKLLRFDTRSWRCKLLWTGLGITRPGDVPGQGGVWNCM